MEELSSFVFHVCVGWPVSYELIPMISFVSYVPSLDHFSLPNSMFPYDSGTRKISGTRQRNLVKLGRSRKFWYLLLRFFWLILPKFNFWKRDWALWPHPNLRFFKYFLITYNRNLSRSATREASRIPSLLY